MNKWICDCHMINVIGTHICHRCGTSRQVTKTSESVTNENLSNNTFTYKYDEKCKVSVNYTYDYDPEFGPLTVVYSRDIEKLKKQNEILTEALIK